MIDIQGSWATHLRILEYWSEIGIVTRLCLIVNIAGYMYTKTTNVNVNEVSVCLAPILD